MKKFLVLSILMIQALVRPIVSTYVMAIVGLSKTTM